MAIKRNGNLSKYSILHNGTRLRKGYHNSNVEIWSAGNIVTYHVDNYNTYNEEVDYGATCLSPTSFVPYKDGWIFVGWREDAAASANVLNNKVMDSDPIVLYAVFKRDITVYYYNNSDIENMTTGVRYYNNANVDNPSFTLTQTDDPNWTERGWSTTNSGDAEIIYGNGETFTREDDITLYGLYEQNITLTYNGNGSSSGSMSSQSGTRYWAPAVDDTYIVSGASFTSEEDAFSNIGMDYFGIWTPPMVDLVKDTTYVVTWDGIDYECKSSYYRDEEFGVYVYRLGGSYGEPFVMDRYVSVETGEEYGSAIYCPSDTVATQHTCSIRKAVYVNPKFTLAANGFDRSNYTFLKWALGSTGGVQYAPGSSVTLSENTTAYAVWEANEIIVFTQTVHANPSDGGSVSIYDRNYVNMTDTRAVAWVYYADDTTGEDTETITINYGRYKTAVIEFASYADNADTWYEGTRRALTKVNGVTVYSSTDQTWDGVEATYTLTTTATSITMYAEAEIKAGVGTSTWVQGFIYPTKITLKK